MLDAAPVLTEPPSGHPPVRFERAKGRAEVSLSCHSGRLRIGTLAQSGSAKVFLPESHATVPEIVFLNTAGGLTGGDSLTFRVVLEDHAKAVAATQTAERAYRSHGGAARMDVALDLGEGAHLDWLPQETILFEGAKLDRRTVVRLGSRASILMVESLVLGRAAMGETVARLSLTDRREIWRGGAPVVLDPFGLTDASLARRHALLGGDRAIATMWFVAGGAEDAVAPLRAALGKDACVSGWNGRCALRLAAADGFALRRRVAAALYVLRRGAALPRVWQI